MSSDPIEVLREAVTALKTMHGPFDHDYIKDEKCCDRCRLLVRAESALASLPAPKPESAEAGVVVNVTPNMATPFLEVRWNADIPKEGTKLYTAPPRPEASLVAACLRLAPWISAALGDDEACAELKADATAFLEALESAPQQASAPVGVGFRYVDIDTPGYEGWINLFWGRAVIGRVRPPIATEIRDALAQQPAADDAEQFRRGWQAGFAEGRREQQPAAVDPGDIHVEPYPEQFGGFRTGSPRGIKITHRSGLIVASTKERSAHANRDAAMRALAHALAGQQQGGPQE